jgi:hypothetical protein
MAEPPMNPFDSLAKPAPPQTSDPPTPLSEILEEKCAGEDPADDLYWGNKDY